MAGMKTGSEYIADTVALSSGQKRCKISISKPVSKKISISGVTRRVVKASEHGNTLRHRLSTPIRDFNNLKGVAKTHELPQSAFIDLLYENGITDLMIHTRNPKDCILSMCKMRDSLAIKSPERYAEWIELDYSSKMRNLVQMYGFMKNYNRMWAEFNDPRFNVIKTRYEDLVNHPIEFFDGVFSFYGIPKIALPPKEKGYNWRKGKVGSFEEECPDDVKHLFD